MLGETELEIEVEEPEPELDPGATRLRERPPERDATIVRPVAGGGAPAARRDDRRRPGAGRTAPPAPPPRAGSRGRRRPPPAAAADAQPFGSFTPAAPARRRTGAATRQWGPATIVFLVIIATAIALIIYFAAR